MLKTMTLIALVCAAAPLGAAEKGQWGLVGEPWGPTQLGAIWHVGERYALRPAVGGLRGSYRLDYRDAACVVDGRCGSDRDVDWGEVAGGVDLLRYLAPRDGFSPYLGLGVDLRYASADADGPDSSRQTKIGPRLVVGLHHAFGSRVAIYGEVGVETSWYRRERSELTPPRTSTEWNASTFASAAGVVLYLN